MKVWTLVAGEMPLLLLGNSFSSFSRVFIEKMLLAIYETAGLPCVLYLLRAIGDVDHIMIMKMVVHHPVKLKKKSKTFVSQFSRRNHSSTSIRRCCLDERIFHNLINLLYIDSRWWERKKRHFWQVTRLFSRSYFRHSNAHDGPLYLDHLFVVHYCVFSSINKLNRI